RVPALRAGVTLQDRVRGRLAYFLPDLFRRVEADREGGARRARRIEAPQPPHGLVQALADEIVQCGRQRDARRAVLRNQTREGRLRYVEIERVGGQVRLEPSQNGEHSIRRLPVIAPLGPFSPPLP